MIVPQEIYHPLYEDKEKFIILITGGRGSGKSFNASTFIERLTFEMTPVEKIVHQILYTRYTMVSAGMSIIPEMMEKIDLDGTTKYFKTTKTNIVNKMTKSRIMFRGIKTSSGNQTAKLKSIQGITTFVCDEAEEWISEDEFDKIMLSIRKKGIQNRIIIIMNPCDSNHFIYKKYIEKTHKLVEIDGVQVQISTHPNVLHIHTTYFDNLENLSPEFLKEVENIKVSNPEKYGHVVIGRWADVAEGAVFKKWGIVDEFPAECKKVGIGLDFGYSMDPTAIVRCGIWDNRLYLDEVDYRTGLLSTDIVKSLRPWGMKTIADSADPRLIQEIHNGGIRIYAVEKGAGSINAGIDKMQSLEIFVTKRSYNLQNELRNYVWDKDKDGRYINTPVDANNHCFRGDTLITTINGDIPIKDIRVGDYVLTRNGYKKVLKKHNNGVRKVIEKEVFIGFEKRTFFATLEHKFNANGKWKKYGKLTKGDKLFVLSNLTGECTNGIQMGNTPIITIGNLDTETNRARCCIMPFTNSIMGKFRMERLSTTLTTIRSITRLKTLKRFQEVNIIGYIRRKLTILSEWVLTQKAHIQNQIGIKEELRQLPDYRAKRECASNVADDSQQQMFISDFAQRNAITNGSTPRLNVRQKWCANTAESHSWGKSILSPNAVQKNAHINCKQVTDVKTISESYCEVYDLTIEGEHEYFANGVLVHNCIDAVRYYVLGELLGKIQKPKDLTGIFTH